MGVKRVAPIRPFVASGHFCVAHIVSVADKGFDQAFVESQIGFIATGDADLQSVTWPVALLQSFYETGHQVKIGTVFGVCLIERRSVYFADLFLVMGARREQSQRVKR